MKKQGLTYREMAEKLGYKKVKLRSFYVHTTRNKEKYNWEYQAIKKVDLVKKEHEIPPSIQKLDKLTQMRYIMASKNRYIKQLEMENELMQDFLSLTE